jgi:HD domain
MMTPGEARVLLITLGAPARLIGHVELVGEAAEVLVATLDRLLVPVDSTFIRCAVILHDAGKIQHTQELDAAGSDHEPAGEALLLSLGVAPTLARCCLSHARWTHMSCSLEELIVALADNLWKGKRLANLETAFVKSVCQRSGLRFWDIFIELDACFEAIAAGGDGRLIRSRQGCEAKP